MAFTASQVIDARRRMVPLAFPNGAVVTVSKAQIDAAMAAAVAWAEANKAGFVSALTGTVLENANPTIQAQALAVAVEIRYG